MDYSADWTLFRPNQEKYVHSWRPHGTQLGSVCLVHGLGEHGWRYHRLARYFAEAGFDVFTFDQQGHGQSKEKPGCIASYDSMLDDIEAFLDWTQSQTKGPIVLFGHSMGGNLVLNYAMRRRKLPRAMIASSPMIRAVKHPSWLVERVGRVMLHVCPNYRLQSNLIPERLMSDPDEQEELLKDELFHSQLSLRLGAALLDSGQWSLDNAHQLETPTLLTHGTNDYMTCIDASREFALRAGTHCVFEPIPDELHEPFRGKSKEEVAQNYVEFMRRLTQGSGS